MGDHELAAIQHIVAHQSVEELDGLLDESGIRTSSGQGLELARDCCSPWVICTSLPEVFRISFMS
jgi:hypothetical protein